LRPHSLQSIHREPPEPHGLLDLSKDVLHYRFALPQQTHIDRGFLPLSLPFYCPVIRTDLYCPAMFGLTALPSTRTNLISLTSIDSHLVGHPFGWLRSLVLEILSFRANTHVFLANANFVEMIFDGGAASYKFDFGGTLRRDAKAKISTSMAPVEIRIPSATAAKVVENTIAAALDIGDGFMKKGGAFLTEAALTGKTPLLTIRANVSLGTLSLRSTQ
jgi:hypothetical protein